MPRGFFEILAVAATFATSVGYGLPASAADAPAAYPTRDQAEATCGKQNVIQRDDDTTRQRGSSGVYYVSYASARFGAVNGVYFCYDDALSYNAANTVAARAFRPTDPNDNPPAIRSAARSHGPWSDRNAAAAMCPNAWANVVRQDRDADISTAADGRFVYVQSAKFDMVETGEYLCRGDLPAGAIELTALLRVKSRQSFPTPDAAERFCPKYYPSNPSAVRSIGQRVGDRNVYVVHSGRYARYYEPASPVSGAWMCRAELDSSWSNADEVGMSAPSDPTPTTLLDKIKQTCPNDTVVEIMSFASTNSEQLYGARYLVIAHAGALGWDASGQPTAGNTFICSGNLPPGIPIREYADVQAAATARYRAIQAAPATFTRRIASGVTDQAIRALTAYCRDRYVVASNPLSMGDLAREYRDGVISMRSPQFRDTSLTGAYVCATEANNFHLRVYDDVAKAEADAKAAAHAKAAALASTPKPVATLRHAPSPFDRVIMIGKGPIDTIFGRVFLVDESGKTAYAVAPQSCTEKIDAKSFLVGLSCGDKVFPMANADGSRPLVGAGGTLIGNDGSGLVLRTPYGAVISAAGPGLIGNDGSGARPSGGMTVISNDGSTLIGNDGSSLSLHLENLLPKGASFMAQLLGIVAQGGGNIVAQGGGNSPTSGIVSTNGNNIVSTNGNNIVSTNGNNIVSTNGNNIVSTNGNNIITDNGSGFISHNGSAFNDQLSAALSSAAGLQRGLNSVDGGPASFTPNASTAVSRCGFGGTPSVATSNVVYAFRRTRTWMALPASLDEMKARAASGKIDGFACKSDVASAPGWTQYAGAWPPATPPRTTVAAIPAPPAPTPLPPPRPAPAAPRRGSAAPAATSAGPISNLHPLRISGVVFVDGANEAWIVDQQIVHARVGTSGVNQLNIADRWMFDVRIVGDRAFMSFQGIPIVWVSTGTAQMGGTPSGTNLVTGDNSISLTALKNALPGVF